jgi:16S rRNA processing protein RimM
MDSQYAVLGTIVKAVGLKGEVKLLPGYDFWPESLDASGHELVSNGTVRREVSIERYRIKGGTYILRLSEIDSIDKAESLVGLELRISLDGLEDEVRPSGLLPCQLMGFSVLLSDGSHLGTVVDMLIGNSQNCFIVEGGSERYLIPDVGEVVCSIDPEERTMEVNPPQGLLDFKW